MTPFLTGFTDGLTSAVEYNRVNAEPMNVEGYPKLILDPRTGSGNERQEYAYEVLRFQITNILAEDGKLGPETRKKMQEQDSGIQIIQKWSEGDPDVAPKMLRKGGLADILGCGLHTTGYGEGLKRLDEKYSDDAEVDLAYADRMDTVLSYKGNYLIGRTGLIFELIPCTHFGYHTGGKYLKRLRVEEPPEWWQNRYQDHAFAGDLLLWSKGSVNRSSIGIDFLARRGGGAGFSDAQILAAEDLIAHLCSMYSLDIDDQTVIDHSSLDWISRATKYGPWDLPDSFDIIKLRENARDKMDGLDALN